MKRLITIPLALVALFATGCAAVDVARERVGSRLESLTEGYCEQSPTVRAIARIEANEAVKDKATVVVACAGEPGYQELRTLYVDPLGASSLDVLTGQLIRNGTITLPDGTRLRVVVDSGDAD